MNLIKPWLLMLPVLLSNTVARADTPDSLEHVLHTEVFSLSKELEDTSEYGQDMASTLKANACRLKTEARIGAASMRRVLVLSNWRDALDLWEDLEMDLVMLQSGGGTMWSHAKARNNLAIEEFLDGVADKLPLEEGEIPPALENQLNVLLKEAKARLAKASKDAAQYKTAPAAVSRKRSAEMERRLTLAHQTLCECFRFSGNQATTRALLKYCKDCSETWNCLNKPDDEP